MSTRRNTISPFRNCLFGVMLCIVGISTPHLNAQGCTQCRDNASATPPATQRAYRHAIALLTVTAAGIFAGTVLMLRRSR